MSGKINPVLREAVKAARRREQERRRKVLEKEGKALEPGCHTVVPPHLGAQNDTFGEIHEMQQTKDLPRTEQLQSEEEVRPHMPAKANSMAVDYVGNKNGSGYGENVTKSHEVGARFEKGDPCLTQRDSSFNPELDIGDLESDLEVDSENGQQNEMEPQAIQLPLVGPYPPKENSSEETESKDEAPSPRCGGNSKGSKQGQTFDNPRLPKRRISMMNACRDIHRYEKLNRISEGTYGVVYRGLDLETKAICALKRLKINKERSGFPLTSVREINILLALEHPNIVNVSEVVMGHKHTDPRDDQIFMVMEYADHDLSTVMQKRMKQPFTIAEVKCLMIQLLSAVAYLHENWVIHRDLKTANILYTNKGQLKICDFGLARQYSSFTREYTQMVVTLWYRAPELLLGTRKYSSAIDIWSVGCIMGELLTRKPLLPGRTEIEQLQKIYDLIGDPGENIYSHLPLWGKMRMIRQSKNARNLYSILGDHLIAGEKNEENIFTSSSRSGVHLLQRLLDLNPETRISAREALNHPWFSSHPLPKDREMMPTFKATNDSYQLQNNSLL